MIYAILYRELEHHRLWHLRGVLEPIPADTKGSQKLYVIFDCMGVSAPIPVCSESTVYVFFWK